MSLHMVRNGLLTVVQEVLQVLFILGLVAAMVGSDALLVCTSTTSSSQTLKRTPASDMVSFGGSALNVFADKGSSSLVSARVPPDTIGTS